MRCLTRKFISSERDRAIIAGDLVERMRGAGLRLRLTPAETTDPDEWEPVTLAQQEPQASKDDQVKLQTRHHVMGLLEHYEDLTFKPLYQRALKLFASREEKEWRALKIEVIETSRARLVKKWEDALGPKWRDDILQLD
jgi:hypothetical protein